MDKIKYLMEIEKYLYKYTLIGDNNLIDFFKKEEGEIISNLSIEEKLAAFDELVYNTNILDENIATEFSIIYQFNNHLKKLPLKRLANILIDDILKDVDSDFIISESIIRYLSKEKINNSSFCQDGISFKYDLVERMIGNAYEEQTSIKKKISTDLFFAYPILEEDRRLIHDKKSANILAKRLEMTDFLNMTEKEDILMGFTLDTMLGSRESIGETNKSKNFETSSKIYLESIADPLNDDMLDEMLETFSYNAYEYNDTPYYKEVVKVFSKKLTHNINEWFN